MTQNVLDYSQNPSGVELMDTFLAGMAENQLTNHSGISRPSYAKAGTFWIDTSVTPWVLKQFTGSDDVILGTLDQTNLMFTARRALQDGSGNVITTTYLPVNGTAARATADGNGNVITSTYLPVGGTATSAVADGNGNNIIATYATKNELSSVIKPGFVVPYGGSTPPSGWLICDGSAISRTTYEDLFAVTGTTYGAGDGSTTFNIPNISSIVKSVNTNVPIKGSGMALGFTNGSSNFGVNTYEGSAGFRAITQGYGASVGTEKTSSEVNTKKVVGLTTDTSKSGIIGTVTRSVVNFKFIIKY